MVGWWNAIPVQGAIMVFAVGVLGVGLALSNGGLADGDCESRPLAHVYKPSRLKVLATCQDVTGTVVAWRLEHDGDWHVAMTMDDPGWTNRANDRHQHGYTVVEFVPLLDKPPRFYGGQRLRLRTTKVLDNDHAGWVEGHPVFAWNDVTPIETPPAANRPALAPPTED